MISRRNAIKFGAVGLMLPAAVSTRSRCSGVAAGAQLPVGSGPSLSSPIVVKWTYETGAEFGSISLVEDGVVYGSAPDIAAFALDEATGNEVWRVSPSGSLHAVFGDGLVLIDTPTGEIAGHDAATGAELWRFSYEGSAYSPVIANGAVYFGTETGTLHVLDAATGQQKWEFLYGLTHHQFEIMILLERDTVFVTGGDSVLYALDAATGSQKWRLGTGSYWLNSLSLENGVLYFTSSEGIHAVDPETGNQLWLLADDAQLSSNLVFDNGVMFVGLSEGPIYAINAETGEFIWQMIPGGYGAIMLGIDGNTVTFQVATGGQMFPYYNLHALDKTTGEELWRSEDIWNSLSYTVAGNGTIVVGETHPKATDVPHALYALDTISGNEIWRMEELGGFLHAPLFSSQHLFACSRPGIIHCLGNLEPAQLATDVSILGAPAPTAVERGTATAGDSIDNVGTRNSSGGLEWVEVTINGTIGWIPLNAIDPDTLPPESGVKYVYVP